MAHQGTLVGGGHSFSAGTIERVTSQMGETEGSTVSLWRSGTAAVVLAKTTTKNEMEMNETRSLHLVAESIRAGGLFS
jgi:hypothetical protein